MRWSQWCSSGQGTWVRAFYCSSLLGGRQCSSQEYGSALYIICTVQGTHAVTHPSLLLRCVARWVAEWNGGFWAGSVMRQGWFSADGMISTYGPARSTISTLQISNTANSWKLTSFCCLEDLWCSRMCVVVKSVMWLDCITQSYC